MKAFIDVDVQDCLQRIVDVNTLYYKADFEYDIPLLKNAAIDKVTTNFLWLSRESGTYMFPERNVYVSPSSDNHTWRYYQTRPEEIKAFYVEVNRIRDGRPLGSLIELDYIAHCKQVEKLALPADCVRVSFIDGSTRTFGLNEFEENKDAIISKYGSYNGFVNSASHGMDSLLYHIRSERNYQIEPYNFERYMTELRQEPFLRLGYRHDDYFRLSQWEGKSCFDKGLPVFLLEKDTGLRQITDWSDIEYLRYKQEHLIALRQQDRGTWEYIKPENADRIALFSPEELYRLQSYLTYVGKNFEFTAEENVDLQNLLDKINILTNAADRNFTLEQEQEVIEEPGAEI